MAEKKTAPTGAHSEAPGHVPAAGTHVRDDHPWLDPNQFQCPIGLLLCRALGGRKLSEAVAVMPRFPQVMRNLPRAERGPLPDDLLAAVEEVNAELDGTGRVLVRPSGTEPLVRVLAEAETPEAAEGLCARIADLVTRKLG